MSNLGQDRAFMVTVKLVKKHWFRDNEYEVLITDGHTDMKLKDGQFFTLETSMPLYEQLLWPGGITR